jgi:YYY domain-containing protein
MSGSLIAILGWVIAVELLAVAAFPLAARLWRGAPALSASMVHPLSLIVVGYFAWVASMLGFLSFGQSTVVLVAAAVGLACWLTWRRDAVEAVRRSWRTVATFESAFVVTLAVASFVRAYNADIVGQEKFMDYALMNTFLTAPDLPAEDPWLAGYGVPYYHLGYLVMGIPAKIAGTPGPIAYNLALALVFAATLVAASGIVYALIARADGGLSQALSARALCYGLLGGAVVVVIGNLEGALELIAATGLGDADFWRAVGVKGLTASPAEGILPGGAWWWRASRVIPNIQPDGITEFPYFSFILGDLHPHFTALPQDLLLIGIAVMVWTNGRTGLGAPGVFVTALLLGVLVTSNTWDVPVFWGIVAAAMAYDAWRMTRAGEQASAAWIGAVLPFAIAPILISPYLFGYGSQPLGIGLVRERTPLPSMLILFGPVLAAVALFAGWLIARRSMSPAGTGRCLPADRVLLVLLAGALGILLLRGEWTFALLFAMGALVGLAGFAWFSYGDCSAADDRAVQLCWLLGAVGVVTLLGVEILFIRDVFGTRMNTVFKFHYNAWLVLGLAAAAGLGIVRGRAIQARWPGAWQLGSALTLLLFLPGLVYPIAATWTKSGAFRAEPTLDGSRFLQRSRPSDADGVAWLRANAVGRPVVVEAVGPDYQEFARVSTFSGLPTVIGWIGHELQWRGQQIDYGRRERDVEAMYRATSREEIVRLARPYRARYLFFGALERDRYGDEAVQRLGRFLTPAFARGGTLIFNVPDDASAVASE